MIRSASDGGALYGSVNTRDIADAATAGGFSLDRRQVTLDQPIKELGLHPVGVVLHPEVEATIHINVARSREEAELQASGKTIQELQAEAEAAAEFDIEELFDDIGAAADDDARPRRLTAATAPPPRPGRGALRLACSAPRSAAPPRGSASRSSASPSRARSTTRGTPPPPAPPRSPAAAPPRRAATKVCQSPGRDRMDRELAVIGDRLDHAGYSHNCSAAAARSPASS